jgi:hypothetical protein
VILARFRSSSAKKGRPGTRIPKRRFEIFLKSVGQRPDKHLDFVLSTYYFDNITFK